jgi:predicted DNA-binding transcriptional regulator YafY
VGNMPKSANQKLKLLYLIKLFNEKTDDEHHITMTEITDYLADKDITAERKAIYSDIEALRCFGYDIRGEKVGASYQYYLAEREFELLELKLLIDVVQSSKSVSEEKSRDLIRKLEHFTSDYNARNLHKRVIVKNRVKSINEKIYYTMDAVDEAINTDKRISFDYFQWNLKKELVPRKNKRKENISPWAFIWDNECYYMLGYDSSVGKLKHYRLDKMAAVAINPEGERDGKELFGKIDLALYSKEHFSMFGGDICTVKLECKNTAANYIIDKFGTDIMLVPKDDQYFTVNVDVVPSKMFFGWIIGLGSDVRIISPKSVRKELREKLKEAAKNYQ